jgi:hypothetical protein
LKSGEGFIEVWSEYSIKLSMLAKFSGKQKPRSEFAVNAKYLDFQDNFDKLSYVFWVGYTTVLQETRQQDLQEDLYSFGGNFL